MATASAAEYLILDMNVNGHSGRGMTEHRKRYIAHVLNDLESPLVVCVQEFVWVALDSRAWIDLNIPNRFQHVGHKTGFMLDTTKVTSSRVDNKRAVLAMRDEMVRRSAHQTDFFDMSRLCVCEIEGIDITEFKILCVSWHGPHNKMIKRRKLIALYTMLQFLQELKKREGDIPLLLGGDFNLSARDVRSILPSDGSLELHTPDDTSIDMFITSSDLRRRFSITNVVTLEGHPAFDHKPLKMKLIDINPRELPTGNKGKGESSEQNLSPVETETSPSGDETKKKMKGQGESSEQNLSPVETKTSPSGEENKKKMKGKVESSEQNLSLETKTSPTGDETKKEMKGKGESSEQNLSPVATETSPSGDETKKKMKGKGESSEQNLSLETKTSPSGDETKKETEGQEEMKVSKDTKDKMSKNMQ